MNTTEFFSEIYRGCDSGYITLTLLPERKTLWFKVSEIDKVSIEVERLGKATNTFFGVGLRKKILTNNLRGNENDICAVTTLYADIDIKSSAHAQTALPSSIDEAISFLNSLSLKPSVIVNSGNGVHAYWVLDEPFKIQSSRDKEYISSVFKGWNIYMNSKARERGWQFDNVSDLARILRVPGSVNHKLRNGSVCEVITSKELRYEIDDFEPYSGNVEMSSGRMHFGSTRLSDSQKVIDNCDFINYCKENAARLPEPYWHVMITNLASTKDGAKTIHELSKPYPKYNKAETDRKIKRAIKENKPHTCKYIHEHLGFECSKSCNVKAPIVHGTPSKEQSFIDLTRSESLCSDEIFSKENMELCTFAKSNMPAEYARLKSKLKGKINLRDFEKAVRYEANRDKFNYNEERSIAINLNGINLSGAVMPPGWNITMKHGIQKESHYKDSSTVITVCPSPTVITKRLENFDDGSEKIELSFYRDGRWKKIIASRSSVFNRNSIIKYADSGLPISSSNATELISYLSDYEIANMQTIPLIRSISRVGWMRHDAAFNPHTKTCEKNKLYLSATENKGIRYDFFPYYTHEEVVFESESNEVNGIIEGTSPHGDIEVWKKYALKARENPFARFLISASFASPLLKLLDNRVFFIHIWHDSQSGKTAAIKFGISVWGDPGKLMGSFNATSVGLERMAGMLKHLPFAIDELQVLNDHKLSIEKIVYSLGNGFGRVRGNKTGGMQSVPSWQSIMLTSGEQPMSNESSNDGAITRVLELYGKPVDDVQFAHDLHIVSNANYGLVGKEFIKFLINNTSENAIKQDYKRISQAISDKCSFEVPKAQLDNVAVVCLGDYYSGVSVFKTQKEQAWNEAVDLGLKILENCRDLQKADTTDRAWEFVLGWISSNKNRFSPDSTPCYGKIEQDKVYVIPNILRGALKENGFDYSKVTRGFKERCLLETRIDNKGHSKMQISKSINGIVQKCFCIKEAINMENSDYIKPLTKPF